MSKKKLKVVSTATAPVVQLDVTVASERDKLIASKLAAGLTREQAESAADQQIDRDHGVVRSPFPGAGEKTDAASDLATEGVNLNQPHVNPDAAKSVPLKVKLNVKKGRTDLSTPSDETTAKA